MTRSRQAAGGCGLGQEVATEFFRQIIEARARAASRKALDQEPLSCELVSPHGSETYRFGRGAAPVREPAILVQIDRSLVQSSLRKKAASSSCCASASL